MCWRGVWGLARADRALTQAEGWPVRVEVVGAYVFPAVAGLPAAGSAISLSTADFVEAVEARLDRVLASVEIPAGVGIEPAGSGHAGLPSGGRRRRCNGKQE